MHSTSGFASGSTYHDYEETGFLSKKEMPSTNKTTQATSLDKAFNSLNYILLLILLLHSKKKDRCRIVD